MISWKMSLKTDGRYRILNVIDEYSREYLAVKVDISINSQAVIERP